jgi:HEAT repeat protein
VPVDPAAASRTVLSPTSGVHERTIAELIITLRHKDSELQEEAIEALSDRGEEAIDALHLVLRRDVDARARAAAAAALARIGSPRAWRAFRPVLRDRDVEVRSQAVEAIAGETSDEAIVILREAQTDPNEHVRRTAADALEALEDVEP